MTRVSVTPSFGPFKGELCELFATIVFTECFQYLRIGAGFRSGAFQDDIDFQLVDTDGWPYWRASVDSYDNKERIYFDGIGGKTVELRIIGDDVTADNEGCGTNSMKVYYAYILEDADRDDGNGPCEPLTTGCPNESNDVRGVDEEDLE